jgi:hypothetical protein
LRHLLFVLIVRLFLRCNFLKSPDVEAVVTSRSTGRFDAPPVAKVVDEFADQVFEAMWVKVFKMNRRKCPSDYGLACHANHRSQKGGAASQSLSMSSRVFSAVPRKVDAVAKACAVAPGLPLDQNFGRGELGKCLFSLARSERFELPTLGIEIRCSNERRPELP